MRHARITTFLILSIWGAPAWSVDISFEEARAAYLQNMQALGVVNFVIEHETLLTVEYFDVLQQRIGRYEGAISALPAGSNRDSMQLELARLKELFASKEVYPVRKTAAIVIGSRAIQIAVPSSGPVPGMPVETQADFTDQCLHSVVLCWSGDQNPNAWMWQGKGGRDDGVRYATISSKRPQDILGFPVPPVGAPERVSFEQGRLSPFDGFFEDRYDDTQIIGSEEQNGQPVLVVERRNESLKSKAVVRALLSINHGFFPVRIEGYRGAIVDVPMFHETQNGGFYPARWTIQRDDVDDRNAAVRNSDRPFSVRYTKSVESWTVEEFQSNQQEPPLFSAIGFPEGTYCLNEDKQTYFTVGKPEEVVDTMLDANQAATGGPQAAAPVPAAWTDDRSWLFWVNLGATVGIIALFAARRMLRRREE